MIFGEKQVFAIECEIVDQIDSWVYANFCFWIEGAKVGAYQETIVLKASIAWLKEFLRNSEKRCIPLFDSMDKEIVFRLIYETVIVTPLKNSSILEMIPENKEETASGRLALSDSEIINRFHLDDVGMSSFDEYSIILINREDGKQRIIWKHVDESSVHEAILPPDYFENIAIQFVSWAESYL
jgi:hypothetical protein